MRTLPWLAAAILATSTVIAGDAPTYTYIDLVERLTDLEGLAVLPPPGEKCGQQSSYDRRSRYDAASGKFLDWSANGDGHGIIRKEGEAEVLAEMEGPGVIWRIWSAAPRDGRVKAFLDGATEPAVDLPFIGFFDGKNAPFVYPSIVNEASRGQNSYLPIPFRKSCRIIGEKGWGDFYHFTYTTYPPGTTVPTFTRNLAPAEIAALEKADRFLTGRLGTDPAGKREGEHTESRAVSVPAHGKVTIANLQGPRAITALKIKFHPDAMGDVQRTLREAVLQIRWDGEAQPSVWAPIGDFFGTAPGLNRYRSLPLGISAEDEGYSYWYMPFEKGAVVEIIHDGDRSFPVEVSVTHAPLARKPEELGRFHAKWHLDAFLNREPERAIDWPMLRTEGRGRFCGVTLHIWNPRGGWWGEGDEKFFVDGEKFPSTFGTGSEDYFGYAWGDENLFQKVYHDQTVCDRPPGNVSLNRWHITDDVPFQTSFEGSIEKYWDNKRPCQYAAVAYWYLAPGRSDGYPAVPVAERTGYRTEVVITTEPGALEAENLKALEWTGGMVHKLRMIEWGDGWSGGYALWWERPRPGDKLVLALPVAEAGRYEIKAQFAKGQDRAIVEVAVDGVPLGKPVDCYGPRLEAGGQLSLGTMELSAGDHKLSLEVTGINPKGRDGYQVGLDYVKLVPAK